MADFLLALFDFHSNLVCLPTLRTLIPAGKLLIPCNRIMEDLGWTSRADINIAMQEIRRHFVDGVRKDDPQEKLTGA